ncbi:MAG: SRPBCC domain-containing protein [Actinomycetota bacterium]|nr:SRPBCC domain-containing protein [Actinomycetota bacterium]
MSEPAHASSPQDRLVTSTVEVAVDPDAAFAAFTQELDLWWVRGPINHHAGGRVLAMRCEPGVGGRLLEVYDDTTGDALELGRITAWEPGKRLAWTSSLDDVRTEVEFEPCDAGTVVRVVARIAVDGQDRGGTAWTRVVPKWFGPWCARRDVTPHEVRDLARLALAISYDRPATAARWLADAFGFESPDPLPEGPDPLPETEHGHPWIEFRLGNSSLMISKLDLDRPQPTPTHVPWVYVDDIAAHYQRACSGGATVVRKLGSPWGLPFYVADDPEGNRWTFVQARPTMR